MISSPSKVDYCERPDQRCYRLGVVTIGSKDIVLEYTVPKRRAYCASPAEALSSGSISDFAENGAYDNKTNRGGEGTDRRGDVCAKDQYRQFIAGKISRAAPTAQQEAADQAAADSWYEQAGIWLRDSTRDAKKFPILWNELVSYGFRRDLLGSKWPALAINMIVVAICAFVLWRRSNLDMSDDVVMHTVVVLVVAAVHAVYIAFVVTREGVKEAARRYGRELILS